MAVATTRSVGYAEIHVGPVQPFTQQCRTPSVAAVFLIGLDWVVDSTATSGHWPDAETTMPRQHSRDCVCRRRRYRRPHCLFHQGRDVPTSGESDLTHIITSSDAVSRAYSGDTRFFRPSASHGFSQQMQCPSLKADSLWPDGVCACMLMTATANGTR